MLDEPGHFGEGPNNDQFLSFRLNWGKPSQKRSYVRLAKRDKSRALPANLRPLVSISSIISSFNIIVKERRGHHLMSAGRVNWQGVYWQSQITFNESVWWIWVFELASQYINVTVNTQFLKTAVSNPKTKTMLFRRIWKLENLRRLMIWIVAYRSKWSQSGLHRDVTYVL